MVAELPIWATENARPAGPAIWTGANPEAGSVPMTLALNTAPDATYFTCSFAAPRTAATLVSTFPDGVSARPIPADVPPERMCTSPGVVDIRMFDWLSCAVRSSSSTNAPGPEAGDGMAEATGAG